MELVHRDAGYLAETIKCLLDETANQVLPPDTGHMTEEYAARVAAKVADLQGRHRRRTRRR